MVIPDEFMIPVLKGKINLVIRDAPERSGSFVAKTERITMESNPHNSVKYGIIAIQGCNYKRFMELTDKDVQRAGYTSKEDFVRQWTDKHDRTPKNEKLALIEFELVAVERFGHKLLRGGGVGGDSYG
jgi:hypothetical protein